MPRRNDLRQAEQPNTLFASAQNLQGFTGVTPPKSQSSSWQDALWTFYDNVGEFEFVARWVASMLSKARLTIKYKGEVITTGHEAAMNALDELFGGLDGKAECLGMLGIQATVGGESYIVASDDGTGVKWNVYSPQAITKSSGVWKVDGDVIPGKPLIIRTYSPHPRRQKEATSSARSAIPILTEIFRTTQHIEAQLLSRLTSGGLLLLPNEMTFASASTSDAEGTANASSADTFVRELVEVASAAINNRGDASATIPIVMTADGEHLEKARLLEFWSSLDENAQAMRAKAIERLGIALDVPPEVLSGMADASHWQMWGVDDASIKTHAEPLLARICRDLTEGYLRPALKGEVSEEDLKHYELGADTTALRVRPNRSKESIELWEAGELSAEAMRRENGFDETDVPSKEEREAHLYRKVGVMAADPSMAAQALQHLGLDIDAPAEETEGNMPQEGPSLEDHPENIAVPSMDERKDLADDAERKAMPQMALLAAAEQMVYRALERAGNKAKSKLHFSLEEGVEPSEFYLFRDSSDAEVSFMLEGAFPQCDRFAPEYGMSGDVLRAGLEEFTRELIKGRKPYERASLAKKLLRERVDA